MRVVQRSTFECGNVLFKNVSLAAQRSLRAAPGMARSSPGQQSAKRSSSLRRTKKRGSALKSKEKPIKLRKYSKKKSQSKAEEAPASSKLSRRPNEEPTANTARRADSGRRTPKGKGKGEGKYKKLFLAASKPFEPYYDGRDKCFVFYGGKTWQEACWRARGSSDHIWAGPFPEYLQQPHQRTEGFIWKILGMVFVSSMGCSWIDAHLAMSAARTPVASFVSRLRP